MPSVASFMMPAAKCVTAMPEDKLSSVVASLVNEKIGCVVVVDPASERAVGIVTKQDVNRMFLNQVRDRGSRCHRHRKPTRCGGSTRPRAVCFRPTVPTCPIPTETPACRARDICEASARPRRARTHK